MISLDDYRKLAERERATGDCAELPNRKAVHEQAAQVSDRLAGQAETLGKRQADRGNRPRGMSKPADEPGEEQGRASTAQLPKELNR